MPSARSSPANSAASPAESSRHFAAESRRRLTSSFIERGSFGLRWGLGQTLRMHKAEPYATLLVPEGVDGVDAAGFDGGGDAEDDADGDGDAESDDYGGGGGDGFPFGGRAGRRRGGE